MKLYILWIAKRQLFSLNKKAGLFFMTLASLIGVTIGISALVVTLSVMGGFEQDLRKKIFFGLAHIQITHKQQNLGFSLIDYPIAWFKQKIPHAKLIQPFIKTEVIIKNDDNIGSATFLGIDPKYSDDIWGINTGLSNKKTADLLKNYHKSIFDEKNNDNKNQIINAKKNYKLLVGAELALNLQAYKKTKLLVLSPQSDLSGFLGGEKFFEEYEVSGIFHSKRSEYNANYVVSDLDSVRRYMDDYDDYIDNNLYVTGVAVTVHDPENLDHLIIKNLNSPDLLVNTWRDANRSLLGALLLEKVAMGTVLFLIVIVAIFSLSGSVMMTVYYKRNQIALLRGLGMTCQDVIKIFIAQGALIGTIGVVFGLSLGLSICYLVKEIGIIALPQGIYQLQKLPVKFLLYEYIIICALAFILIICASVYPAMIAGKQDPGNALRY